MGRLVTERYIVSGTLTAKTPVHVGGAPGADILTDMPLARDGKEQIYLPGTSLAGPIRTWWRRQKGSEVVFGATPGEHAGVREGYASYLSVYDAPARAPIHEIRDGVGIDRETGAAASGIKYDRQVLARETQFTFHMEIEFSDGAASVELRSEPPPRPDNAQTRCLIGALIRALEQGHIRFGAAKTRGLGRLQLTEATVRKQAIGNRKGVLALLRQETANASANLRDELVREAGMADSAPEAGTMAISITWRPDLPVMSKSDAEGVSVDALPMVGASGEEMFPIITGASWKGVLRAHAERICRTIEDTAPPEQGDDKSPASDREFIADVEHSELAEALFGSAGKERAEDEAYRDVVGPVPGLGALSVDDCVIGASLTREEWLNLLRHAHDDTVETKAGGARRALEASPWAAFRAATHVAIDRWTGAAADSLLFSGVEPPVENETRTLHLLLDLDRIAPRLPGERYGSGTRTGLPDPALATFRQAVLALLVLVLRDLAAGRIPVGFGSTRGFGSLRIEEIAFAGSGSDLQRVGLPEAAFSVTRGALNDPAAKSPFAAIQSTWTDYWTGRRHWAKTRETAR